MLRDTVSCTYTLPFHPPALARVVEVRVSTLLTMLSHFFLRSILQDSSYAKLPWFVGWQPQIDVIQGYHIALVSAYGIL